MWPILCLIGMLAWQAAALPSRPFLDLTHPSKVFGESRNYRILLPTDYSIAGKRYPVIYFFHGHSDRYTLESYDGGKDFIPKMADYVARHDVIVVLVDGYVAEDYTGFYGGTPWDVMRGGGNHDFGPYLEELIEHIDKTYRTLSDRRHRATSGLSMGGFMSFYISARYPHLIGSASAFNPGHEFFAGDPGRRQLWRLKDHAPSHTHTMVRLIRASGDYISQYHEEARAAYASSESVDFEFRQDEYHRHWITSIAETFDFHSRAFANSALDNIPVSFNHANAYRRFSVWGYDVQVDGAGSAMVSLTDVRQGGLRITARQWEPDGPPPENLRITVKTAPRYKPAAVYTLSDHSFAANKTSRREVTSASDGTLTFTVDGSGHQVSFAGPGTGSEPPILLPVTAGDKLRLPPNSEIPLPLRIYNPRKEAMDNVRVRLSSEYPTVQLLAQEFEIPSIDPGGFVDVSNQFHARFTSGGGYFEPTRLRLELTYDGWHGVSENLDVLVVPEIIPTVEEMVILDGRTVDLKVFRQSGNQGGGKSIDRKVTEGKGNGNGILEPGEEATIWVKMRQGMDPFDKGNWYRCKIYSDSPWLVEISDLQEAKQREWTSSMERTSVVRLAPQTPRGSKIPLLLG